MLYDNKRISYVRYKASYFMYQLENTPQIIYFKPDRSISPTLRDDECGIAKLRVTVGMKHGFSDLSKGGWDRPMNKPVQQIGFLFAHIYHAQDLVPADSDGTSDPYCMISYCGVEKKTEIIDDTLNPVKLFNFLN